MIYSKEARILAHEVGFESKSTPSQQRDTEGVHCTYVMRVGSTYLPFPWSCLVTTYRSSKATEALTILGTKKTNYTIKFTGIG